MILFINCLAEKNLLLSYNSFSFSKKKLPRKTIIRFSKFSFPFKKRNPIFSNYLEILKWKILSGSVLVSRNILWFRFDLRIIDNPCLESALNILPPPILVFCPEVEIIGEIRGKKKKFLWDCIEDLKTQLKNKKMLFLILNDLPEKIIPDIIKKFNSKSIFYSINPFFEKKLEIHQSFIELFGKAGAHPQIYLGDSLVASMDIFLMRKLLSKNFPSFLETITVHREKFFFERSTKFPFFFSDNLASWDTPTLKNSFSKKKLFSGGETYILLNLKNFIDFKKKKNFSWFQNFLKTIMPWINFGCISLQTLISFLISIDLVSVKVLIFNFFFFYFQFFRRLYFAQLNF